MPHYAFYFSDDDREELTNEEVVELVIIKMAELDHGNINETLGLAGIYLDFDQLDKYQKLRLIGRSNEFISFIKDDDMFFTKLAARDMTIMAHLVPQFSPTSIKYLLKNATDGIIRLYDICPTNNSLYINSSPFRHTLDSDFHNGLHAIIKDIALDDTWTVHKKKLVARAALYEYIRNPRDALINIIIKLLKVSFDSTESIQHSHTLYTISVLSKHSMIHALDSTATRILEAMYEYDISVQSNIGHEIFNILRTNDQYHSIKDFMFNNSKYLFTEYKKCVIMSPLD